MIKYIMLFWLVGLSSLFADSIAILDQANGDIQVRSINFKKKEGKQNTKLEFGDTIKTGKGASTHIKFNDGSVIMVKENSIFKLKGKAKKFIVDFDKGEFLIGIKRKDKATSYHVKTPSAVCGVRGTLFWGLSDDNLNTTYACFSSSIEISAEGVKKVLLPSKKVFIPFGKEPGEIKPAMVPLSYLDTFAIKGSIQGVKDMLKKEEKGRDKRKKRGSE